MASRRTYCYISLLAIKGLRVNAAYYSSLCHDAHYSRSSDDVFYTLYRVEFPLRLKVGQCALDALIEVRILKWEPTSETQRMKV
jgi:hypothetical protein